GDGMQLAGTQFTDTSALVGNDISTLPDFPAEIRAPAGTLAGVSGYQLHFSSESIYTPGDAPDVLVAMNPAALKQNLEKVGYKTNPIEDGSLEGWRVFSIDMGTHVANALEGMPGIGFKELSR